MMISYHLYVFLTCGKEQSVMKTISLKRMAIDPQKEERSYFMPIFEQSYSKIQISFQTQLRFDLENFFWSLKSILCTNLRFSFPFTTEKNK